MNNMQLLIADASQELNSLESLIKEGFELAERFFLANFGIDWGINVVATSSLQWLIIPEDGVGGKTYASDFIVLAINPSLVSGVKVSEMLAHELAHAVRWDKNSEWSRNLFCELVNEGLATYVEAEFAKEQSSKTFFLETVLSRNDDENRKMLEELRPEFSKEKYDYTGVFFGNEHYARWEGYSAGYYIVKRYLEITRKSVFEAISDRYDEFLAVL